jgi:hypothetical protein
MPLFVSLFISFVAKIEESKILNKLAMNTKDASGTKIRKVVKNKFQIPNSKFQIPKQNHNNHNNKVNK